MKTQQQKPLPVVLRFWHRGEGYVRLLLPDGSWKWVTKLGDDDAVEALAD